MYYTLLFIHSWLRWVVLILAIIVIVRSFSGWFGKKAFTKADNKNAIFFVSSMHLQLLIGLILYFVYSEVGYKAFQSGMSAVMSNKSLRYWAVEHISTMIIAVVLVQIGRTRSKKAKEAIQKHKNLAIFSLLGIVLVLIRIPWDQAERMFRGL